ncbi:uncharacterized protein Z520_01711 [Fonsecaea multimorphosa CBS 102226]|uniref:Mtf2-like C-terminal domain-containing protein n=1 Tax=Fonsecaea multimorphosa CBS 102226 TaxID=1442371 RepID=A0A0D2L2H1_9EURO|nr:uncharacterized protein Z520_01711 [Fonsecaea multimorphosa CBS 102226]KIY03244.1 hypothetical protein Z520_01711 [Fonsecaea multimorphosa CBS 102226]OAL30482.1 hypothetical protein AYO22_01680 [Fonsecaea multimorphosa]
MAARMELPFLYHTRTILRLPKRTCRLRPRFASSQVGSDVPVEDGKAPLSPAEDESFLKAKARSVTWSPIASDSTSSNAETTISSTITASERRAFETILRFAPKQTEPTLSKRRKAYADAADTDIENILNIFTSSLRSHRFGRDGSHLAQKPDGDVAHQDVVGDQSNLETPGEQAQTTQPVLSPLEQSRARLTEEHDRDLTDQLSRNAKEDSPENLSVTLQTKATSTAGHSGVQAPKVADFPGLSELQEEEGDILAETAIPSRPFSQVDGSIQNAVRDHLHSISRALQEAAHSKTKKGDIAMWEVCESRIFAMARDLQQPRPGGQALSNDMEKLPRCGGLQKFTFSREKSDNPRRLIEAAERELRRSSPSSGTYITDDATTDNTISSPTLSATQLAILQHTYPASLLLALRLYINLYPSSPYALLLLPRIRSLGTTSYVLGASPQFYNSLMSLVWLTRSSLREVDGLLAEMERGGVEMDEETQAVLGGIEEDRAMDLVRKGKGRGSAKENGDKALGGSRGAAWWKRQEQMLWFPRILDWLDIVAGRLAAKERLV